jgi:tungstate transport system ATP-binding protein
MLFQDPLLFNTSVENNVTYGLKIRRLPPEERDRRLRRSLAMVHMEDFRESRGYTLSGGEAQRVALARALVVEPELILLDEPFANLDRLTKKELQEEVRGILRESGLAAVFVTHDQDEAGLMGDRIVILNHGRVVQKGTAREVFFHPSDRFAAHFVGMDNVFEGKVVAQQDGIAGVDVDGARFELMSDLPVGSEVTVGLRPEDVTVVPAGDIDNPASSRNAFAGTVEKVEIGGPTARVTVRCPLPVIALITTRSLEELEITEGSKAGVRFKATAPHVF